MPLFGPPNIEKMKAQPNVDGLVKALRYKKDSQVRKAAAEALCGIQYQFGKNVLLDKSLAWSDPDPSVQALIGFKNQQFAMLRAIPALIQALEDEEVSVRESTARVLALMLSWVPSKHEQELVMIMRGLVSADSQTIANAIADGVSQDVSYIYGKFSKLGDQAVDLLTAVLLKTTLYNARRDIILVLGKIGSSKALPALLTLVADDAIENYAVAAIKTIGSPPLEPLIALAENTGVPYRARRRAVTLLRDLGWHPDMGVAGIIYWMVQREWDKCIQAGSLAVEPLIASVAAYGSFGDEARVLGAIDDARTIDALADLVLKWKSKEAAEVLANKGQAGIDILANMALSPELEWSKLSVIVEALAKVDRERSMPLLLRMLVENLGEFPYQYSQTAVELLDMNGWEPDQSAVAAAYWIIKGEDGKCLEIGQAAVEPLLRALREKDPVVHKAAARTLVQFYTRGQTDEPTRQKILAVRERIIRHDDRMESYTYEYGSYHVDEGINVDFPL